MFMLQDDIACCSINEEYNIFTSNKVISTYRRGIAFLMADVKKATKNWELHSSLKDYDPSETQAVSLLENALPKLSPTFHFDA